MSQLWSKKLEERQKVIRDNMHNPDTVQQQPVQGMGASQLDSLSKEKLYELAKLHHVEGRSHMTRKELIEAVRRCQNTH